ncbi:MAG: hypothetical protein WA220_00460 [Candidatus Nitrosopolaris sp.]
MVSTLLVSGISGNIKTFTIDEYFQNFCREIVKKHYFIRSAAIADNVGHFMASPCWINYPIVYIIDDCGNG